MGREGMWELGSLLVLDRWGVSRETGKSCKVGRRPTQQYGNRLWLAVQKKKLAAAGPRAGTWFAMAVSEGKGWTTNCLPDSHPDSHWSRGPVLWRQAGPGTLLKA